jgi:hypothetical protein
MRRRDAWRTKRRPGTPQLHRLSIWPPEEWIPCRRKVPLVTRREALTVAKATNQRTKGVEPYHCALCKNWHVGHPPRRAS